MITLAVTRPHSMVSDDYYKDGLSINLDLSKDDLATQYVLEAKLSYDKSLQTYRLALNGQSKKNLSYDYLLVSLEHPTLPNQDTTIQLMPQGGYVYTARHSQDLHGKRYITITPPGAEWRLTGETIFPLTSTHLTASKPKTSQN